MSLATTIAKAKLSIRDFGDPFQAQQIGDGTATRYDLPAVNVDPETVVAYTRSGATTTVLTPAVGSTPASGEYLLEPRDGLLILSSALPVGTLLVVEGQAGFWSLPSDFEEFVELAFDLHAKGRVPELTWDNVDPAEEYAIALLAAREALWAQITEAASQVDVTTPEGMHIPGGAHYRQLMDLLDRIEAHYKEFAQALNVGPFRIQMFTLRRISRTTNRLVPLYVPREIEDTSPPVRIYPAIDPGI